jgi:hypothetical protein
MPIARWRVTKHVPAETYLGTIGHPFLGNRAVKTPTNWETVFSVGSVQSGYKGVEFRSCRRFFSFVVPPLIKREGLGFFNNWYSLTTPYSLSQIKVKVTLWLTVSQSVSLGIEPHLGPMTRYLFLSDSYVLVSVWRPLWREDWSVFCMCRWPLLAQPFSGPSPLGLATVFYCLRWIRNPCGGGVEYLHRDPASRKRRRNGKSQVWDSKIWSRVPMDSDLRKTAFGRPSSIYKGQTRPLVREGAPQKKTVTVK